LRCYRTKLPLFFPFFFCVRAFPFTPPSSVVPFACKGFNRLRAKRGPPPFRFIFPTMGNTSLFPSFESLPFPPGEGFFKFFCRAVEPKLIIKLSLPVRVFALPPCPPLSFSHLPPCVFPSSRTQNRRSCAFSPQLRFFRLSPPTCCRHIKFEDTVFVYVELYGPTLLLVSLATQKNALPFFRLAAWTVDRVACVPVFTFNCHNFFLPSTTSDPVLSSQVTVFFSGKTKGHFLFFFLSFLLPR